MICRLPNIKHVLVATIFLITLPLSQSFAAPIYAELGYLGLIFKEKNSIRGNIGLTKATVGYLINDYLSVEGYYATNIKSKKMTLNDGSAFKMSGRNFYGVYVKPQIEVDVNLKVYAKLGWNSVQMKFQGSSSGLTKIRDKSFGYGVGAQYALTDNHYLSAGYEHLYQKGGSRIEGWSIMLGYLF